MHRFFFPALLSLVGLLSTTISARSEGLAKSRTRFYYSNFDGSIGSARIMRHYWVPVTHPDAPVDSRLDPRLRSALIALIDQHEQGEWLADERSIGRLRAQPR